MYVNFPSLGVLQNEVEGSPTFSSAKALLSQGLKHPRKVTAAEDDVDIVVAPRLFAKQSVDRPAPVEPDLDSAFGEPTHELRDVVARHRITKALRCRYISGEPHPIGAAHCGPADHRVHATGRPDAVP
jgi:hypothetical protein